MAQAALAIQQGFKGFCTSMLGDVAGTLQVFKLLPRADHSERESGEWDLVGDKIGSVSWVLTL